MERGYLRLSAVEHTFALPFTADFERFIIQQQALGKDLLAFDHLGGFTYILYFGETTDSEMDSGYDFTNVVVSPWKLYLYNSVTFRPVKRGKLFLFPRAADEVSHTVEVGDFVELVSVDGFKSHGMAVVQAITRTKIAAVTKDKFKRFLVPLKSQLDLVRQMQVMYDQTFTTDSVVCVLTLKADTNILPDPVAEQYLPYRVPVDKIHFV